MKLRRVVCPLAPCAATTAFAALNEGDAEPAFTAPARTGTGAGHGGQALNGILRGRRSAMRGFASALLVSLVSLCGCGGEVAGGAAAVGAMQAQQASQAKAQQAQLLDALKQAQDAEARRAASAASAIP